MNSSLKPKVGQLLFHERLTSSGEIDQAALYFVDKEPVEGEQWFITWVAQMEDYNGKGLEVFTEPAVGGGGGEKYGTRIATDEDIMKFIQVIRKATDAEDQARVWIKRLDEEEEFTALLLEEKERLMRLISGPKLSKIRHPGA